MTSVICCCRYAGSVSCKECINHDAVVKYNCYSNEKIRALKFLNVSGRMMFVRKIYRKELKWADQA